MKKIIKQRIVLVLFGIFLGIALLEIGMRMGGAIFLTLQERRNKIPFEKKNVYIIMCVGGSTTARGGEDSWPVQLENILNKRNIGIKFRVINKGIEGVESTVIVSKLKKNLEKYNPDMVIAMMGVNDWVGTIAYENSSEIKLKLFIKNFRVYKLGRALWVNCVNKIEDIRLKLDKAEACFMLGADYKRQGRFNEAEKMIKKGIDIEPQECNGYVELGDFYMEQERYREAEDMLKKAIGIDSKYEPAYTALGLCYKLQGKTQEIYDLSEKIIKENFKNDRLHGFVATTYREQGKLKEAERYYIKANEFRLQYYNSATRHNYRKFKEILVQRGIKMVAVQYPVRNVEPLKKLFESTQEIIFVDNEKVFKDVLSYESYDDYFDDCIGGEFGHATAKGNRLLAGNIADVVVKEVFDMKN